MPEGPEVRRYALQLAAVLDGEEIVSLSARTKNARAWIEAHPSALIGKRIEEVRSHGKHLFGRIEGGFGFHSHLMMWGRWLIVQNGALRPETRAPLRGEPLQLDENGEPIRDRRERARIVVPGATALLFSAPVFEIFEGNPYEKIENLSSLGPDVLPYDGVFDADEFRRRLCAQPNKEIGAVLLDQRVCAGIGNYLRAEILFFCRLSPWTCVGELSEADLSYLSEQIPLVSRRALDEPGVSIPPPMRQKLLSDASLSYGEGIQEWNARHAVFRRTNLPCLACGEPIRQKKQVVYQSDDGDASNDKARPIFFCPNCQNVPGDKWKPRTRT